MQSHFVHALGNLDPADTVEARATAVISVEIANPRRRDDVAFDANFYHFSTFGIIRHHSLTLLRRHYVFLIGVTYMYAYISAYVTSVSGNCEQRNNLYFAIVSVARNAAAAPSAQSAFITQRRASFPKFKNPPNF